MAAAANEEVEQSGGVAEAAGEASLAQPSPRCGEKRKNPEAETVDAGHSRLEAQQMISNGLYADVIFETNDRRDQTPAHRCILVNVSPVFRAMFQHCMLEQETKQVRVEDMSTGAFRVFLHLLYTGTLVHADIEKFGLEVSTACHKYEVPQLAKICNSVLGDILTVENALSVLEHATVYDESLFKRCKNFIACHMEQVVGSPTYEELAVRKPKLIVDLVRSVHLKQHVKELKISFRAFGTVKMNSLSMRRLVDSTVGDLLKDLRDWMALPPGRSVNICGISDHRIVRFYNPRNKVEEMEDEVKIEEIFTQEVHTTMRPLRFAHILVDRKGNFLRYFGEPFTVRIPTGIHFLGRLKERISATGVFVNGSFGCHFVKRSALDPYSSVLNKLYDASPLPVDEDAFLGIVHPICQCDVPDIHSPLFHLS